MSTACQPQFPSAKSRNGRKKPESLSDYWLVRDKRNDEAVGLFKSSRRPATVEAPSGAWIMQIGVDNRKNPPRYTVRVKNEIDIWEERYYLEAITESEGKTYAAMKMKLFDADD